MGTGPVPRPSVGVVAVNDLLWPITVFEFVSLPCPALLICLIRLIFMLKSEAMSVRTG